MTLCRLQLQNINQIYIIHHRPIHSTLDIRASFYQNSESKANNKNLKEVPVHSRKLSIMRRVSIAKFCITYRLLRKLCYHVGFSRN